MNYADETMKAKYAGTAFEFLFSDNPAAPALTAKELAEKARRKRNNDKTNAKRKANNISAGNKQKANWTI